MGSCYELGDFIQVVSDDKSKFLNTLTGESRDIELGLPINNNVKIDFNRMIDLKDNLKIINSVNGVSPWGGRRLWIKDKFFKLNNYYFKNALIIRQKETNKV